MSKAAGQRWHKTQPRYARDDGPLSERDFEALRTLAKEALPAGKLVKKQSLF